MDRGAWQATAHGVEKSQTRQKRLTLSLLGVWALETDQGQMQDLSLIKHVSVNTITSPYSHWIGSCLAFLPHLPLHTLSVRFQSLKLVISSWNNWCSHSERLLTKRSFRADRKSVV